MSVSSLARPKWVADRAATAEDRDARGWRWTVPVGCYPAGRAGCGAVDMAGNVREWTADEYRSYPGSAAPFAYEDRRVLRGGNFASEVRRCRCGARYWYLPAYDFLYVGFRVVVAP